MRLDLCGDKTLLYDTETDEIYCNNRPCLNCPLYNMAVEEGMITEDETIDCKKAGTIIAFSMLEHNIKELIKLL